MSTGQITESDAAKALAQTVRQWVAERYWPGRPLPEGLRLEMHPTVSYALLRNLPGRYAPAADRQSELADLIGAGVPVLVTPFLETGAWRLVTVTEDVHTGGTMPP